MASLVGVIDASVGWGFDVGMAVAVLVGVQAEKKAKTETAMARRCQKAFDILLVCLGKGALFIVLFVPVFELWSAVQ